MFNVFVTLFTLKNLIIVMVLFLPLRPYWVRCLRSSVLRGVLLITVIEFRLGGHYAYWVQIYRVITLIGFSHYAYWVPAQIHKPLL